MKEKRCKNCECWDPQNKGDGICRAKATSPVIMQDSAIHYMLVWPTTGPNDWCYHDYVPAEAT